MAVFRHQIQLILVMTAPEVIENLELPISQTAYYEQGDHRGGGRRPTLESIASWTLLS